jgi:hypothetical protein
MKYSLGIVWYTVLAGCVFSVCDVPVAISFDTPFFSSPYMQVVQSTMHVWSDIREAAEMVSNPHNQDDYTMCVHAILGQLLCVEHAIAACDATVSSDDIEYLTRVVAMVHQEATALSLIPVHVGVMQQLFGRIEKKLTALSR